MAAGVFRTGTIFLVIATTLATILEPPSIVQGPLTPLEYLPDLEQATIELNCVATGAPKLEYEWRKDNQPIQSPNVNKLTIERKFTNENEGYYQCLVRNSRGTAVSNVTRIIKARQAQFQKIDALTVDATVGQKLTIGCRCSELGVPYPRSEDFSWKDSSDHVFQTNKRVQTDEKGNLHFSAVTSDDFLFERTCYVHNRINIVSSGGGKVRIRQTGDPVASTAPVIMFFSNQSANAGRGYTVVRALEKQNISLRCFFSGSENINVEWRRHDFQPPHDRMPTHKFGSELIINNVEKSDDGEFVCHASNAHGSAKFTTVLAVYASPEFKSDNDKPHNVNVTVGDDVTFNCNAYANPRAEVAWFKNGNPLNPNDQQSNKFRWNNDRTSLTLTKVCKDNCTGGTNDIMVIQCNASNDYGYAFSNGFINVFERTELVVHPENVLAEFPYQVSVSVSFYTSARSDPSTPVIYKWYFNGNPLVEDNNKYNIHDDGRNLTVLATDDSDVGTYSCNASNGISSVLVNATLASPNVIAAASIWPLWWLPIVLLLLFLLILAIVMFVVCTIYRNRGEDYPVDETERKCGNDPEKDLADAELQPFSRQDTISTHSLGRSDAGSTRSLLNQTGEETMGTTTRRGSNDNMFGTLR